MKRLFHLAAPLTAVVLTVSLLGGLQDNLLSGTAQAQESNTRTGRHPETGMLTFLGASPTAPVDVPDANIAGLLPIERAVAILEVYGPRFGVDNPNRDLILLDKATDKGQSINRYQQVYQGVPVLGGELIVHATTQGDLISLSGEASPDLSVAVTPSVSSAQAQEAALDTIARVHSLDTADLTASEPELWIFDERLLVPSTRPAELVWRMEVTPVDLLPIRELVLVNAETGSISLHFNQVDTAWSGAGSVSSIPAAPVSSVAFSPQGVLESPVLSTYTANNTTSLPGTLLCTQAAPFTQTGCTSGADSDADWAHYNATSAYNFYATYHGRDSFDNAGAAIVSTVHYDTGYANAGWTGTQMIYGDVVGYAAADDVVAHELTHGVTNYESNVIYVYQSGAINESFSDLWGEFVDLTNGSGNDDDSVRWLMGEDVTGKGAGRNMKDPPNPPNPCIAPDCASGQNPRQPDRMTSEYYYTDWMDNGGVHINSGVNNKAVSLLTDGGTFNGYTITGLGIDKVATIYYEVQTNLLTSGSDYLNLYYALYQGCLNKVGTTGITTADCDQVRMATEATEMNIPPAGDNIPPAGICPMDSDTQVFYYNEDFDGEFIDWSSAVITGHDHWSWTSGWAASGTKHLRGSTWNPDYLGPAESAIQMNSGVALPAGQGAYLRFDHVNDFFAPTSGEPYHDGGVVEYSTDGGSTWHDMGAFYLDGKNYGGVIPTELGNPLGGRNAFVGHSHGYVSTRYDLSPLAGNTVKVRFHFGSEYRTFFYGWIIDNVQIYSCASAPTLSSPADGSTTDDNFPTFDWSDVADASSYELQVDDNDAFTSPQSFTATTSIYTMATPLADGTHYWRVRSQYTGGGSGSWSPVWTVTVNTSSDSVKVWCDATVIRGHLTAPVPYVRVSVSLNASPYTTLADVVFPVQPDGSFNATATYALQATGTYLSGFYEGWDGSQQQGFFDSFEGGCTAPASRPTLVSPANALITGDNYLAFDWGDIAGGGYTWELQIDDNGTFSSPEIFTTPAATSAYTASGLSPDGLYYWRVRQRFNTGGASSWSYIWVVTVDTVSDSMNVWCDATVLRGHVKVPAPYYRLTVSTTTPITTIANVTVPVQPDGSFLVTATHPLQPTGTGLIIGYGEWTGSGWVNGATLVGKNCKAATPKPALVSPANGSTTGDMTPTFDWADIAGSGFSWELHVDDNGAFSSPDIFSPGTTSAYTPTTPLADGIHYWRVRQRFSDGRSGNWSYVWEVTTHTAPELLAPEDGLTTKDMSPTFDWSDAEDLADVWRYDGELIGPLNMILWVKGTSDVTLNAPIPDGVYTWRMRVQDTANAYHNWSETRTLTIDAKPELLSPANGSTIGDATPIFDWEDVGDAVDVALYELQVDDNDAFTSPQSFMGTTSTYTMTTPLADGAYFWRVRLQDTNINYHSWHNWSETRSLTVDAVPDLLSPANGSIIPDNTPDFDWDDVADAVQYQIQIDDSSAFTSPLVVDTTVSSSTYTLATELADVTYYWRVRAQDAAGLWSAYSAAWRVVIDTTPPAPPALSAPAAGASVRGTPTYTWLASATAARYQFRYGTGDCYDANAVYTSPELTTTNHKPPTQAFGMYSWCARARDAASNWSGWNTRTITILPLIPAAPALTAPANALFTSNNTPEFSWASVPDGNTYQIQIDKQSTFTAPLDQTHTGGVGDLAYTPDPALPDGLYYWRVRAYNVNSEPGAWSAVRSLTADTVAPTAPTLSAPADKARVVPKPTLSVLAVTGARQYQFQVSPDPLFGTIPVNETRTTTSYTLTNTLGYSRYYWRAQTIDAAGNPSGWSAVRSFSVTIQTAPADGANLTTVTPTFTWSAVSGAQEYHLQVARTGTFSSLEVERNQTSGTSYLSPALDYGTYYWRMQVSTTTGEWGEWMPAWQFTVTPVIPPAPTLSGPANALVISDNTPTLVWNAAAGDDNTYQVQVDNQSNFASPERTRTSTVGELSYTVDPALTAGVYYWRVRTLNYLVVPSAWSAARSFTLDLSAPLPPVLSSPAADASVVGTPTYAWLAAATAAHYQFQYDDSADCTSPLYASDELTALNHKPPTQAPGVYYWCVRARDAAGNWSPWSTPRMVTIRPPVPAAPTLVSPANALVTNNTAPVLSWNSVPYGDIYEVQVDAQAAFTAPIERIYTSDVGELTYTVDLALPAGLYYWRVRAINSSAVAGHWSAARSFTVDTTAPLPPAPSTPASGASVAGTPTYSWLAAATATRYQFQYDDSTDCASPLYTSTELTVLNHKPLAQAPGTYYWCVMARDAAGNWSAWSSPRAVTIQPGVPAAPTPVSPVNALVTNDDTPTLSWNSVPYGNTYQVQVDRQSTFTAPIQRSGTGGVGELIYTVDPALTAGLYYWRVRAINASTVAGAWSATRSFTIDLTAPLPPALSAPAKGASVVGTPTYSWLAAAGAARYQFQYDDHDTCDSPLYTSDELAVLNHKPPEQVPGVYYWCVRARDAAGSWSSWSTPRAITIQPLVPAAPTLVSPANGSISLNPAPTLTWDAVPYGVTYQVQLDNNSTFGSPELDDTAATTSRTPTPLADGVYYWRVRSINSVGTPSAWSAVWRVTISQPIPAAPVLTSPSDTSTETNGTPTFSWESVTNAASYQIRVDNNADFGTSEFDDTADTISRIPTVPLANGAYSWRVRAINAYGTPGGWSTAWTVTISAPPAMADLVLSETSSITSTVETVDFDYVITVFNRGPSAATGVTVQDMLDTRLEYRSHTATQGAYDPATGTWAVGTLNTGATATLTLCVRIREGTAPNTTIPNTVVITALDGVDPNVANNQSLWNVLVAGPLLAPSLSAPANVSIETTGTPTFSWESVENGATYQIQVDNNANFRSPEFDDTAGTTSRTPTAPLSNGIYSWHVRTIDAMGTPGQWSGAWTLTVIVPPPLTVQSLQFWPDVTDVDRYSTFDFGARIDFESAVTTKVSLLGFFTYQGEEVPSETTCMGRAMPGRGGELFWSTGVYTELAPGANSFERQYTYDQSAPDDATHLVMWLMFLDASDQMLTCWQKVIALSPVSP